MSFVCEERLPDSPFVETITQGHTASDGFTIRPAENHWHMVLTKYKGHARFLLVGPQTTAGSLSYEEGAELLWIKFKLGTFLPHLPLKSFLNVEAPLSDTTHHSFYLNGSSWQFPNYDNADTFVNQLARKQELAFDPVVSAILQGQPPQHGLSPRTIRHRVLHATGLTQNHIFQIERAQRAAALLQQGVPILDTTYETGYFDQPHLTRSLKQWIGHTPAQIVQMSQSEYSDAILETPNF